MRLLGIDYGTKKVGLALSNEEGTMAFPHDVIPNDGTLVDTISALIKERNIEQIVIGKSYNLEGKPNVLQEDIDRFVNILHEAIRVSIVLEPEQFSTQEALRTQGRTKHTDASAAALILDTYIQKNS